MLTPTLAESNLDWNKCVGLCCWPKCVGAAVGLVLSEVGLNYARVASVACMQVKPLNTYKKYCERAS